MHTVARASGHGKGYAKTSVSRDFPPVPRTELTSSRSMDLCVNQSQISPIRVASQTRRRHHLGMVLLPIGNSFDPYGRVLQELISSRETEGIKR